MGLGSGRGEVEVTELPGAGDLRRAREARISRPAVYPAGPGVTRRLSPRCNDGGTVAAAAVTDLPTRRECARRGARLRTVTNDLASGVRCRRFEARQWVPVVASAALVANLAAQPLRGATHAPQTDYTAFATGARILDAGSSCLYCPDVQARFQSDLLGYTPQGGGFPDPFTNPPLVAWLLRPLGALPLGMGLAVFSTLSILALVVAAVLAWRRLQSVGDPRMRRILLVAAIAALPGAETLTLGQWDAFLLLAVFIAAALVDGGRPAAAGMVLSVLAVKPQLLWLVVPTLLLTRHWRVALGVVAGSLVWILSAVPIVGLSGLDDWVSLVLARHVGEAARTAGLPGLIAALTGTGTAAFVAAVVLGTVALAVVAVTWRSLAGRPVVAMSAGVAVSIVCAPHVYSHDLLLMAFPLVVISAAHPRLALALAGAMSAAYVVDNFVPGRFEGVQALAGCAVAVSLLALSRDSGACERPNAGERRAAPAPASPAPAPG
jgi:glycosyl transferase family 87